MFQNNNAWMYSTRVLQYSGTMTIFKQLKIIIQNCLLLSFMEYLLKIGSAFYLLLETKRQAQLIPYGKSSGGINNYVYCHT